MAVGAPSKEPLLPCGQVHSGLFDSLSNGQNHDNEGFKISHLKLCPVGNWQPVQIFFPLYSDPVLCTSLFSEHFQDGAKKKRLEGEKSVFRGRVKNERDNF